MGCQGINFSPDGPNMGKEIGQCNTYNIATGSSPALPNTAYTN